MKSSGSSTPRLLGAALIIIAAGAAGFFAYRAKQPDPSPLTPVTEPSCTGGGAFRSRKRHQLPEPKSVPDTLPDITLADRNGKANQTRELWRPAPHGEFLGHLVRALPARDPTAQ